MLASTNLRDKISSWSFDERQSSLEFKVSYIVTRIVTGRFTKFSGIIHADPDDIATGWAEVSVDLASIDTGVSARDHELREHRFFELSRHPVCTYRTRRVARSVPGRFRVLGDLSLHGTKNEVALDVSASPVHATPDGRCMRILASGRVNRRLFGVNWHPLFDFAPVFVGHWVDLKINIESVERRR